MTTAPKTRFESWVQSQPRNFPLKYHDGEEAGYVSLDTQLAYEIWLAAEKAVCESESK